MHQETRFGKPSLKIFVQQFSDDGSKKPTKVTISLTKQGNGTKVHLLHEEIATEKARADFADGWERYYFGEIKKLLEK